jgi:hypothetical protein
VAVPFLREAEYEENGDSPKKTGVANLTGYLLISSKNGFSKDSSTTGLIPENLIHSD